MTRLLDLLAILVVAVVVLLPQPSIRAYPAAQGDETDLDRLAALSDAHFLRPDDVGTAVELARAALQVDQPGWALATLRPFLDGAGPPGPPGPVDYGVHQAAAFAYATLLRPDLALKEAEAGLAACERAG